MVRRFSFPILRLGCRSRLQERVEKGFGGRMSTGRDQPGNEGEFLPDAESPGSYFQRIRWDEIEQFTGGLYIYRPKREDFAYPRSVVDRALRRMQGAFQDAFRRLAAPVMVGGGLTRITKFGFLLQPSDGDILYGLHVRRAVDTPEFGVFISPFIPVRIVGDTAVYDAPFRAASHIAATMVHELAHDRVLREGPDLLELVDHLIANVISPHGWEASVSGLANMMAKGGGTQDEFAGWYHRAREAYLGAARASGRALHPDELLRYTRTRPPERTGK
jgi:hypothetical protein